MTWNGSIQFGCHNPSLWKPQDPKLIWKDVIYTLEVQSSLCTHFRQEAAVFNCVIVKRNIILFSLSLIVAFFFSSEVQTSGGKSIEISRGYN